MTVTDVLLNGGLVFVYRDDGRRRQCFGNWGPSDRQEALGEDTLAIYMAMPLGIVFILCAALRRVYFFFRRRRAEEEEHAY